MVMVTLELTSRMVLISGSFHGSITALGGGILLAAVSLVLVVEDEATVREIACAILADLGYRVLEAADGEEAIARAEETQPDVVLLDVRMPNRGGLSVVAELAARAKVIMLTFTDDDASVRAAGTLVTTGAKLRCRETAPW